MIELPAHDVSGITAANPGPFTLGGTNTWIAGRDPAWVVDPGPALDEHLDAVAAEAIRRGGLGGIALTHDHADHAEGVRGLLARLGEAPVAGARGEVDVLVGGGGRAGPLEALATPGHAPDHLAYLHDRAAFTGDAVLGTGSVFVAPTPGAMAGYLAGLERLRERHPAVLCPGHGPVVQDADSKLDEYIAHRLDRERRLLAALDAGLRGSDEILDSVWDDAPRALREAARVTLAAHLAKRAGEGRLPSGVERPAPPATGEV